MSREACAVDARGPRVFWSTLFALPLLLAAAPAWGAVAGSPHDLIAQGYHVQKVTVLEERCTSCHVPSARAPQDFLPAVPPVLGFTYGASSLACFGCHDGTTLVNPDVDASRTAFHPGSHGSDLTGFEGLSDEATGLPLLEGKRMECVTCHDPHDSAYRPMLRYEISELCLRCHSVLSEFALAEQNASGNHPQGADPAKAASGEIPLKVVTAFTTPFPERYPIAGGRASIGTHWDLGGHLSTGDEGTIVCVTCHAVHGDEHLPPRHDDLLATDPVRLGADLFCEGCHAGERGDGRQAPPHPNPGGTTTGRTYHPADNDLSNGEESIVETRLPAGWPLGTAASRPIICSTCHRSHNAVEHTSILRRPAGDEGFCEACHEKMPLEYHHPLVKEGSGACSKQVQQSDPVTGIRRTCEICHRAHNAGFGSGREADYVPLLRVSAASDDFCVACHPQGNPTCGTDPTHLASHFLGDPTLEETYNDQAPPLRLTPWIGSGLVSRYGGASGKAVVCLSCHTFKKVGVVSGDDGSARFLLARSGNPVEWTDDQEGSYLCTGCHGAAPGTGSGEKGHTHPLMRADIEKLGMPVSPPASATVSGHVNCDSCHRPHEAQTPGGVYMLERVDGTNTIPTAIKPQISFTPTCHGCHDPGQY